ncbi:hypothetical protein CSUI_001812 [Cystoisospora suis]|uniref:Uncharacterized protein n=1 Tax=Cystoisospora suis TaxID=483139 RepID=A0A2C6KJW7_9APIC|nr:hypothetical protein CSUI_001812 [Cystoisospora suis]
MPVCSSQNVMQSFQIVRKSSPVSTCLAFLFLSPAFHSASRIYVTWRRLLCNEGRQIDVLIHGWYMATL